MAAITFPPSTIPPILCSLGTPFLCNFDPAGGRKYRYIDELFLFLTVDAVANASILTLNVSLLSSPLDTVAEFSGAGIPIYSSVLLTNGTASPAQLLSRLPLYKYPDPKYRYIGFSLVETSAATWRGYVGQRIVY